MFNTVKDICTYIDDFIAYQADLKTKGHEYKGMALQLDMTDKQYDIAIKYYEDAAKLRGIA